MVIILNKGEETLLLVDDKEYYKLVVGADSKVTLMKMGSK